jgi:ABC-type polysaccharide/polyol phosphate transport system, ATPase component
VSHNMASIRALCHNGILLENGSIKYSGDIESVVLEYQRTNQQYITSRISDRLDRKGNGKLKLVDMKFKNMNDAVIDGVAIGDSFKICLCLENNGWTSSEEIRELSVGINDEYGQRIIVLNNQFLGKEIHVPEDGSPVQVEFTIKKCPLAIGSYTLAFFLSDKFNNIVDWIDNITTLYVEGGDFFGTGKINRQGLGRFITDYEIRAF